MNPHVVPQTIERPGSPGGPGFSLLEVMVTVAILGVVMAIALPNLLPEVQKVQLDGAADKVASFLARARTEAMTSRRCVRVYIEGQNQPARHRLVMERLNTFDCDENPATAPTIDGTGDIWKRLAILDLERDTLELTFEPGLASTPAGFLANTSVGGTVSFGTAASGNSEVRFRPSGRLWSGDAITFAAPTTLTPLLNDDVVLSVKHTKMEKVLGTRNFKAVLVEGHGLICVLPRGEQPPGTGNNRTCPCNKTEPSSLTCP